ncbi:MAG: hypothetical protein IJY35_02610, partial [Clostridia bacterium]|nr:hypothetical protein [Clostridia bacterium]
AERYAITSSVVFLPGMTRDFHFWMSGGVGDMVCLKLRTATQGGIVSGSGSHVLLIIQRQQPFR